MDLSQLFQLFSNPGEIDTLGVGAKMTASLITTLVGMGITFSALIILMFAISWVNTLLNPKPAAAKPARPTTVDEGAADETAAEEIDEVVAAIAAALELSLSPRRNHVIIRNIRRVKDFQPRWSQAGLMDQLDRRRL